MVPLEKQIMKDFELSNFVVCTPLSLPNRMFNNWRKIICHNPVLKKLKKDAGRLLIPEDGSCGRERNIRYLKD